MIRLLITGAAGQVGAALQRVERAPDIEVVALARQELDISDARAVEHVVTDLEPHVIVNAAAFTAVDAAEDQPETAAAINATAVGHLASSAQAHDVRLVHLSTDYVFDGSKSGWYVETDPICPLGVYGRTKAAGERQARNAERHLVLRTSWVYSATGQNFVRTMLRLADQLDEIGVVDDQIGCPTSAHDIAVAIMELIRETGSAEELAGTYHLASPTSATWFEFADTILSSRQRAGDVVVRPITTSEFPTPAERPRNSRLDSSLIYERRGMELPPWQESIDPVVGALTKLQE